MNVQQQTSEPLFENMLWSRPETVHGAGKLLIVGGQAQEFITVAESYAGAEKAGAGVVRVFLPESTRKITKMLPNIEYAPANTSGSFSKAALADLLDASLWADGVLLAGNLGKNSETNLMLESFITRQSGLLVIASEALESISLSAQDLFRNENMALILSFDEIQKFGIELGLQKPIVSSIGVPELGKILQELTLLYPASLVITRNNQTWVAANGLVSLTTKPANSVRLASESATWLMQSPNKKFEALTTAAWQTTT